MPLNLCNADVLITGGTGTFGQAMVRRLLRLDRETPRRIIVFSRDELKQHEMAVRLGHHPHASRLRYFLGDVRDLARLKTALRGVDIVIHAAALKQVPSCEYNPIEAVKTNVGGAQNLIEAAIEMGVSRVIALSTDKACEPINLYGATKLVAEKLFVNAATLAGNLPTRFAVVRYGNVIGSRGSVVELFRTIIAAGGSELPITDASMTRFLITKREAVNWVLDNIRMMDGGEIFVPELPSAGLLDIAVAVGGKDVRIVGARPGEKVHETLITKHEAPRALAIVGGYEILNHTCAGGLISETEGYHSGQHAGRLTAQEVAGLLDRESLESQEDGAL